jgi:hypothetical protein
MIREFGSQQKNRSPAETAITSHDGLTTFDRRADDAGPITPPLSSKWLVRAGMTCRRWFQAGGHHPGSQFAVEINSSVDNTGCR